MTDFDRAADLVRAQLRPWSELGRPKPPRASRSRLAALAAPSAAARPPREAPRPAPVPPAPVPPAPRETDRPEPTDPMPRTAPAHPVLSGPEKRARLAALREKALACQLCPHLAKTRTQAVFGVGNPDAEILFVGEAPGADEDRLGEPFVGRAGELLTKIILAMGLSREEVFIANVLKCRPDMPEGSSGNRKPRAEEMATCLPYLREQIEIIGPKVLVALGATAMEGLTGSVEAMAKQRGRWHAFHGIPLMATYHPAYLLRNQTMAEKRKVWEDMLLVLEHLGKPISAKQRSFFKSA